MMYMKVVSLGRMRLEGEDKGGGGRGRGSMRGEGQRGGGRHVFITQRPQVRHTYMFVHMHTQ